MFVKRRIFNVKFLELYVWKFVCFGGGAQLICTSLKQDVLGKLRDEASKNIIIMRDFNADIIVPKPGKFAWA